MMKKAALLRFLDVTDLIYTISGSFRR
jgi:hypothetical protein